MFADTLQIDFTGIGGTQTLTASGGNFSATNVPITQIFIAGAPIGNGTYSVTGTCNGGGCLTFDTAANTITIVGAVPAIAVGSSTLLTGSFTTVGPFLSGGGTTANPTPGFLFAAGPDQKGATLLSKVGVTPGTAFDFGQTELTLGANNLITGSSVNNVTTIPDGGLTAMFLGGALVGIEALRRKLRA